LIPLITSPSVISVTIYPGITGASLSAQVNAVPGCKGIILCAYGSGNMPMSDASGMKEALREVVGKEIMVVVISQCGCFICAY
jgi:L-asparaginase/Glu-tRNA(Gln) amidotransferase subunit D